MIQHWTQDDNDSWVSSSTENAPYGKFNSTQLDFKRQVNLQKDYLQVTMNHDSKIELLFKFECVVDDFESRSPLIMSLTCSLL
jgi:hypothetical protein